MRERERLLLQLLHTPFQDALAARLLDRLTAEPHSRASTSGTLANWAHWTFRLRVREAARGAVFLAPRCYSDIQVAAAVTGRSVSFIYMQREAARTLREERPPATITLPPPSRGSAIHTAALHFGHHAATAALGARQGSTPISISGPGCSGSLLAHSDTRKYPAVMSAQLGDEALATPPFANATTSATPWSQRDWINDHACRLCGRTTETIYHLACVCDHPTATSFRDSAHASLRTLIHLLWTNGRALIRHHARQHVIHVADAVAMTEYTGGRAPPLAEQHFLLYWMLMATPWPRSATTTIDYGSHFHVAAALGSLFDSLNARPGYLRVWADTWLSWSEAHINDLASKVRQHTPHQTTRDHPSRGPTDSNNNNTRNNPNMITRHKKVRAKKCHEPV